VVIEAIEKIAKDQGLKRTICHNADWIAGVDFDENIQQDKDDDEAYDDDRNEDPKDEHKLDINEDKYNQIDENKLKDKTEDTWQDER
jgi:hypothetical protein